MKSSPGLKPRDDCGVGTPLPFVGAGADWESADPEIVASRTAVAVERSSLMDGRQDRVEPRECARQKTGGDSEWLYGPGDLMRNGLSPSGVMDRLRARPPRP